MKDLAFVVKTSNKGRENIFGSFIQTNPICINSNARIIAYVFLNGATQKIDLEMQLVKIIAFKIVYIWQDCI